eukprot:Sdes_comp17114_c0_seq1m6278
MCRWFCTSEGPSTNLECLHCRTRYCAACLHSEVGKMQSLIKCAGCGKKPRTKPNKERSVWSSEKKAENGLYVSKICTASGCTRPVWTRGYCADHLKELNHEAMARTFVEILRPSNNNPDVHDESFCEEEYHPRRSKSASCYRDSAPIPGPINWTQDSSDSRDGSAEDLGQSSQSSRKESVFDRLTSV